MTFLEIIRHPLTNLPIEQKPSDSYRKILFERIDAFGEAINSSPFLSGPINGTDFQSDIFKRRMNLVLKGLKDAIDCYYAGKINQAYTHLRKLMKESNLRNFLAKDFLLPAYQSFFRIRIKDSSYPLTKAELFHIPFQLRGLVASQRYSIPGLPSLYISNGLYVAWEELRRPSAHQIQAVRLQNQRELTLLDLTTDVYCVEPLQPLTDLQALYRCMVWPLAAACSVKVKNSMDTFKPEYIIPQLLLQWTNDDLIDGIMYSSTHIDRTKKQHSGKFYNIVLPVKPTQTDTGYCQTLCDLFRSTSVLPMHLRQFIASTSRLPGQETISTAVSSDIESIEIIDGIQSPYKDTLFGMLEHSLNGMPIEAIL